MAAFDYDVTKIKMGAIDYDVTKIKMSANDYNVVIDVILLILN